MPKDYYLVLGIPSDATPDDVKEAYRRLAKEFHPDHYGSNSSPFLDIQEAYSVLSDPVRRRRHDSRAARQKATPSRTGFSEPMRPPQAGHPEPLVPDPFFESGLEPGGEPLFEWGGRESGHLFDAFPFRHTGFEAFPGGIPDPFAARPDPDADRARKRILQVELTQRQRAHGGRIRVLVPVSMVCPVCSGRGRTGAYVCRQCRGRGTLKGDCPVVIGFPPNLPDGYTMKVPIQSRNTEAFFLRVCFRTHPGR